MIRTREATIAQEAATLAPYAQRSGQSAGRRHAEPPHPLRTEYQRDYARIIHSRAFRRLEYKTQVFLNGTGDHLRTRLTHTMEVVSITRCIARALGLNEDLAEAIALAHDLGHAPFGHSGEEALDGLMRAYGGFDHNEQSLRLVELIEKKYPHFEGLNLTFELLEGLQKHREIYLPPPGSHALCYLNPSLEAQVANLADEIAYYSHDLDDGLDCHLIHPAQLGELDVWRESHDDVKRRFPEIEGRELNAYVIRCIIDREVEDVVTTSDAAIQASGVSSVEEVRRQPHPLVAYSEGLARANQQLRTFLYAHLYHHPDVAQMNGRACEMLGRVFEAYLAKPHLLGSITSARVECDGLHRAVCDYLAGMTDRYLLDEYARLFPKA
ncbi:MAG: deoxyguanosinetriphosphate triphosphohydrolase [Chthoniobacteraceae bacterium]